MYKASGRIDNNIKTQPTQIREDQSKHTKHSINENFIYVIIITILFLGVYGYIFDKKLDLNGDNAYYYVLGKALSEGEGYVNIASINKVPNNHYPPGYPFIISLFMHISDSIIFLKLINGIFLLISLHLLFYLFKYLSNSSKIAFVTIFFLLLNSHILLYGTMLMSEMSFILLSFFCIYMVLRTNLESNLFRKPHVYLILIALVGAYYIRSTGLALFAGLILYLLFNRYWKAAVFIGAGFITLATPWIIRGQKLGGSSYIKPMVMINPYRAELGNADLIDYFNRIVANISRYITREIPNSSLPFIEVDYLSEINPIEWLIGLPILILIVYGLYKLGRRGLIIICYLATTFGILLLWPEVWTGVRFVLPVVPLLLFALIIGLYYGMTYIHLSLKAKPDYHILIILVFGLTFIFPIQSIHEKAKFDYPNAWINYFNVADWFKRNNIKDAVVICRKPMLFHINSGTYTSTFKYSNDEKEVLDDLKRKQTDYVILDNLGYRQTYEYLFPVINNQNEYFQMVYNLENPDTYLFEYNSDLK
jgi:hypothetical protein